MIFYIYNSFGSKAVLNKGGFCCIMHKIIIDNVRIIITHLCFIFLTQVLFYHSIPSAFRQKSPKTLTFH